MEAVSPCRLQESLVHLLIAAAGSGRRMGADRNKLLLPLLDRPVLAWTLQAALQATSITWIGVVGQESDRGAITQIMDCLLYTSPSPRDQRGSRMPSSA